MVVEWDKELQEWRPPAPIYLTKAKSVYATVYLYQGNNLIDHFKFDEHGSWAWNREWIKLMANNEKFAAAYEDAVENERLTRQPIPEDELAKKFYGRAEVKHLQRLRQIGDRLNSEEIISW